MAEFGRLQNPLPPHTDVKITDQQLVRGFITFAFSDGVGGHYLADPEAAEDLADLRDIVDRGVVRASVIGALVRAAVAIVRTALRNG